MEYPCVGRSGYRGNSLRQPRAGGDPPIPVKTSASWPRARAILAELARGPGSVSKLARPLQMSLPAAVMQHLAVLEASGLVRSVEVGRVRTCRIEPEALSVAERVAVRRARWCTRRSASNGVIRPPRRRYSRR
jgi:DNA-binding transcriptional ArsR family regulator